MQSEQLFIVHSSFCIPPPNDVASLSAAFPDRAGGQLQHATGGEDVAADTVGAHLIDEVNDPALPIEKERIKRIAHEKAVDTRAPLDEQASAWLQGASSQEPFEPRPE